MTDAEVREDIAFIRRTIEDGRAYATTRSADMVVWGVAVAIGYLGTYAFVRRWSPLSPDWLWLACILLPWAYSLRRLAFRRQVAVAVRPMARAMQMLWLGCGITLTTLGIATAFAGDLPHGWFSAVSAGVLGIGFFASAWLCNLAWFRWVALGWWLGELALFGLRGQIELLPVGAALTLVLLMLPGIVLWRSRAAAGGQ